MEIEHVYSAFGLNHTAALCYSVQEKYSSLELSLVSLLLRAKVISHNKIGNLKLF